MNVIIRTIADWLYQQGKASAGMASIHGVYEAPVPQKLQVLETDSISAAVALDNNTRVKE